MRTQFNWYKAPFAKTTHVFHNEKHIAYLKTIIPIKLIHGKINDQYYHFHIKAWLSSFIDIFNPDTQQTEGRIRINFFAGKAIIRTKEGERFFWQFEKGYRNRWFLTDEKGDRIIYKGNIRKGLIEPFFINDLAALTGLFIRNYIQQFFLMLVIINLIMILIVTVYFQLFL